MRHIIKLVFFGLLFVPSVSYAYCSPYGYTVEFVNGIFNSKSQADENRLLLEEKLPRQFNNQPLTVKLAHNPEHLAGFADVAQVVSQVLFAPISNYDLNSMLRQTAVDDTTRKLLLVGHSQGALYANSMYEYITTHGAPVRSVGVYAVATPASYVAGGGAYITSSEDEVIAGVRTIAKRTGAPAPLPSTIRIPNNLDRYDLELGHTFKVYVDGAGNSMLRDIHNELGQLGADSPLVEGPCFTPPDRTIGDDAQALVFLVADPLANGTKSTAKLAYNSTTSVISSMVTYIEGMYVGLTSSVGAVSVSSPNSTPEMPHSLAKDVEVVQKVLSTRVINVEEEPRDINVEQVATEVLIVATTTAAVASTTPSIPAIVMPTGGGGSSLPAASESIYVQEEQVEIVIDGEATSTPATSTPPVPEDVSPATTTPPMPPIEIPVATSTATTSPPAPTPQPSAVVDTFDTFDGTGWQTFGDSPRSFDFESADLGECYAGGCVVGMGGNVYDTRVPRMYKQVGEPRAEGAFVVHAKVRTGFNRPLAVFTACRSDAVNCLDVSQTFVEGVNFFFFSVTPADDDGWHTYYLGWRQGANGVERCILRDNENRADCTWDDLSYYPVGTTFNGVALWSNNGFRSDVGPPHANIWFDELEMR